jgi:hypothetical protein
MEQAANHDERVTLLSVALKPSWAAVRASKREPFIVGEVNQILVSVCVA